MSSSIIQLRLRACGRPGAPRKKPWWKKLADIFEFGD